MAYLNLARRQLKARVGGGLLVIAAVTACATSPLGRKQLLLIPDGQMNQMGAASFDEMKAKTPIETDPKINAYVRCITDPITAAAKGQTDVGTWEVVVFKDPTANAFALPGGKIGVHTGILPVAKNDAQLAAVLGHEVGHVIAKHGAERVSEGLATNGLLAGVQAYLEGTNRGGLTGQLIMAGLGLGSQVGFALPHSRTQESEADLIGEKLMAQAGFDPAQCIALWKNMDAAAGGKAPPQWLSTHPANANRIAQLQAHLAEAQREYQKAQATGHRPSCTL
jgi:predicted Zn-dependent protease